MEQQRRRFLRGLGFGLLGFGGLLLPGRAWAHGRRRRAAVCCPQPACLEVSPFRLYLTEPVGIDSPLIGSTIPCGGGLFAWGYVASGYMINPPSPPSGSNLNATTLTWSGGSAPASDIVILPPTQVPVAQHASNYSGWAIRIDNANSSIPLGTQGTQVTLTVWANNGGPSTQASAARTFTVAGE